MNPCDKIQLLSKFLVPGFTTGDCLQLFYFILFYLTHASALDNSQLNEIHVERFWDLRWAKTVTMAADHLQSLSTRLLLSFLLVLPILQQHIGCCSWRLSVTVLFRFVIWLQSEDALMWNYDAIYVNMFKMSTILSHHTPFICKAPIEALILYSDDVADIGSCKIFVIQGYIPGTFCTAVICYALLLYVFHHGLECIMQVRWGTMDSRHCWSCLFHDCDRRCVLHGHVITDAGCVWVVMLDWSEIVCAYNTCHHGERR